MESFLLEVADAVNTTLDLETLMRRVAELVKRLINYDGFAILLLNEKRQELRIRVQGGHSPEGGGGMARAGRVIAGGGVDGGVGARATGLGRALVPMTGRRV